MGNRKGTLLYPEEHAGCRNYDHPHIAPLVEIRNIEKDGQYERRAADTELVFVTGGEILLSTGAHDNIPVSQGKLFLLPPGGCMRIHAVGEAVIFVCRLDGMIALCEMVPLERPAGYRPPEDFTVLPVKPPLGGHLKDFMEFVEMGLRCKRYLRERINGVVYALRALYTREELRELFAPVAGPEMIFRNRIFSKLKRNITVEDLMEGSGLSRTAFDRKFTGIMGNTPKRFVNDYKTDSLLHDLHCSHMSIKELCFEYGFSTAVRFSQFCSKHLGEPPGKIRKTKQIE